MNPYTVVGVWPSGGDVPLVAAVLTGHQHTVDDAAPGSHERWAHHVWAENPVQAETTARLWCDYGGQPEWRTAAELDEGDLLVYADGDTAEVVGISRDPNGDVLLRLEDVEHGEWDEPASYDESALLHVVPDDR